MFQAYLSDQQASQKWWLPFTSFTYTKSLNKGSTGSLSIPYLLLRQAAYNNSMTVRQLLFDNLRRLEIQDENSETPFFSGYLSKADLSGQGNQDLDVTLSFADASLLLDKRLTGQAQNYQDVNIMTIASSLIETAQAEGDLGLRLGRVDTAPLTLTRQFSHAKVLDSLIGLSTAKIANGLEWQIDAHNQLNLAYPTLGSSKPQLIFDDHNILSFSSQLNLTGNLINQVKIKGGGDLPIQTYANDAAQIAWGRQESYLSATDYTDLASLEQRAAQYLLENSLPLANQQISLEVLGESPSWQDYDLGDQVCLQLPSLDLNQLLRLIKIVYTYKQGTLKLNLTLALQNQPNSFGQAYHDLLSRLTRLENQ